MTTSASLLTEDHSFALADGPDFPIETARWATGLTAQMSIGTMIFTGVNKGLVHVTTDVLQSAPDRHSLDAWTALDEWEDVVEVTVYAPVGDLRVHQHSYGPFDVPPDLPNLSAAGPGSYRLRVHAQGRDRYYDQNRDDSEERYHLIAWPAEPIAPLIVKATSFCGYGIRLSDLPKVGV